MSFNLTDKDERTLSSAAREKIEDFKRKIRETLQADAVREPKLTPEEKAQVIKLEAEIAAIKPVGEALQAQHTEGSARLKNLNLLCNLEGILQGEDFDKMVDEIIHLERVLPMKFDAVVQAQRRVTENENKINRIKRLAREEEARNER